MMVEVGDRSWDSDNDRDDYSDEFIVIVLVIVTGIVILDIDGKVTVIMSLYSYSDENCAG